MDKSEISLVIEARQLSKHFEEKVSPAKSFLENLIGFRSKCTADGINGSANKRPVTALDNVDLSIEKGSVVGIVGKNGSGKSTLLQIVCGTLKPSSGTILVNGRISALLELGAGFNPEFTGIENVRLNAALQGLSASEIDQRLESILDFADIGDFAYRATKTYSSGMFVRLAFAVAVCVEPDILIIDEALSVGDGYFAKKSFDRIMALKESGATILFCSHSLYQVEALCDRVLWLDRGSLMFDGDPSDAIAAYTLFLDTMGKATAEPRSKVHQPQPESVKLDTHQSCDSVQHSSGEIVTLLPRILSVELEVNGRAIDLQKLEGRRLRLDGAGHRMSLKIRIWIGSKSRRDTSGIDADFEVPTVAVTVSAPTGQCLSSVSTFGRPDLLSTASDGSSEVCLTFTKLPLRRGLFRFDVLLGCDRGIHLYDHAIGIVTLDVRSDAVEQGFVYFQHDWTSRCE